MFQIAVLIASILLLLGVQLLRAFLAWIFPAHAARALPPGTPAPASSSDLFQRAHEELTALGFEGPTWYLRDTEPTNATTFKLQAVYRHPRDGAVFCLAPPISAKAPNRLSAYVASRLDDGRVAISQAYDVYFAVTATADAPAQSVAPATLRMHYEGHRGWLAGFNAVPDPAFTEPAAMLDFAAAWHNRQREQLLARGSLWRDPAGMVRPRFAFALRMLGAFLRRPKPPKDTAPVPAARLSGLAAVVEKMRERVPPAHAQWILFAVSALLFAGLGALVWNPRYAVILLVVIGIHELGHYLAMRAFGYRNVHMLALPLIGGVTIGQEANPSASKRAWMSLMGPLPGIVIGWIFMLATPALASVPELAAWVSDAWPLFLVINYLNLLPIPPLDGARVVQAMLPPRWHTVQAGFVAVTCIAGALGASLLGMSAIAVLALLQLTTLPMVLQNGRVLKTLLAEGAPPPTQPRNLRLRRVFDVFERVAGPAREAQRRITQAEAVLNAADQPPMRWWQRSILAGVLAALLVVPVGGVAFFLLALRPHFDPAQSQARVQAMQADHAQFAQAAHALPLAELLPALVKSDVRSADDTALHDAETRLGQPLPEEVAALLRSANGIEAIGLAPAEKIGRADRTELEPIALDGKISVIGSANTDALDMQVPLERASRWLRLGERSPDGIDQLYYDADAQPAIPGQRVIRIDDETAYAYADLRSLLESAWVSQREIARAGERHATDVGKARETLRAAPLAQLLNEFEPPGLIQRYLLHTKGWPPGVGAQAITAAAQRVGRTLPDDLVALYHLHDGLPPLHILQIEWLQRVDAWPELQAALDAPREALDRDFKLVDPSGAETGTTRIDAASLQHCAVLAATWHPRPGAGPGPGAYMPNSWWCPGDGTQADRWIGLHSGRIYPSFQALLLDAAAERHAARSSAF